MKNQDTQIAAALAFTTMVRKLLQVRRQSPTQSCPRLQAHGYVPEAAAAFDLTRIQRPTGTATVLSLPPSLASKAFQIPPAHACPPSSYSQPLPVHNSTNLALLLHVISTASSPALASPSHTVLQPWRLIWPRDHQSRSKSKPVPADSCSVGARTQLDSKCLHLRREANLRHG